MKKNTVKCIVRTKPTTVFPRELISLGEDGRSIAITGRRRDVGGVVNNQQERHGFTFDRILHNASQELVYDEVGSDVVSGGLEGYNGTILVYGQTGAGKTFTMSGTAESYSHRGIIPRAITHIFREVKKKPDMAFVVKVSYLEIYNEAMHDLLSDPDEAVESGDLKIVEDATGTTRVKGLRLQLANNEEEALNYFFEGELNRTIGEHSLNKASSRSHCVFTVHLDMRSRVESTEKVLLSKLNFVDLAGSERLAKTQSEGQVMREAMYINKSLTFLEQVIIALGTKNREHVPYRQSRLTNLLKDSLGGNCRTAMIANIWTEEAHIEETTATLRFASRMAMVANNAIINVQYDPLQLLRKYEREIRELKAELAMHDQIAGRSHVSYEPLSEEQQVTLRARLHQYIDGELDDIEIVNIRQMRELMAQFRVIAREYEQEKANRPRSLADSGGQRPSMIVRERKDGAKHAQSRDAADAQGVGEIEGGGFAIGIAPVERHAAKPTQVPPTAGGRAGSPKTAKSDDASAPGAAAAGAAAAGGSANAAKQGDGGAGGAEGEGGGPAKKEESGGKGRGSRKREKSVDKKGGGDGEGKAESKGGRKHGRGRKGAAAAAAAAEEEAAQEALLASQVGDGAGAESAEAAAPVEEVPPEPPKPADRDEAFEVFKANRGAETYKALVENKVALREARAQLKTVAAVVNDTKREIDALKDVVESRAEARRRQPDYDCEHEVIDEDEYEAIQRLKAAKRTYRDSFTRLGSLRSDAEYLSRLVEQGRSKLIADFQAWFGDDAIAPKQSAIPSSLAASSGAGGSQATAGALQPSMSVTGGMTVEPGEDTELADKGQRDADPEARAYMTAAQSARKRKALQSASGVGALPGISGWSIRKPTSPLKPITL
eukprot:m51a1_g344 putative kinesin-like protein kif9 (890) ;mRNA; r:533624-536787